MPEEKDVKSVRLFNETLNFTQGLFDSVHPIGEIYVQFPQQDDPMTLYNKNGITSVWQEQTQYSGAFFRSSNAPNAIYRADYEIDCYIQDSQTGNLIPINVTALGGPTISPTPSGESIYVEGKEYKRYVVNAGSRNAGNYIKKTDSLTIQSNQNAYHRHTINHGHGITDPGHYHYIQRNYDGITATPWIQNTGDPKGSPGPVTTTTTEFTNISVNNYNGNSGYNGNSSDTESRPNNYTYIIWKRVL